MPTRSRRTRAFLVALAVIPLALFLTACDPAPTITNVEAAACPRDVPATASVAWTTDVASSTQVTYGPSISYGTSTPVDTAGVTSHNVTLSGLTIGLTYHYTVTSTNSTGSTTSPDSTFIATGCNGPPAGIAVCDPSKGYADEACWFNNTGVPNLTTADPNDRWHASQILADALVSGHRPSEQLSHVTGNVTLVANQTYENKWVTGCIQITGANVTIRNVFVDSISCNTGVNNISPAYANATVVDSEVDGGFSLPCAEPPWTGCTETYGAGPWHTAAFDGSFTFLRVNVHGAGTGCVYCGPNTNVTDSYFHDVGHMHNPPAPACDGATDYHRENLWVKDISNWSASHSFMSVSHPDNQACASSGTCLCDGTSNTWVFNNVFMDGGTNAYAVEGCGTHTKVVAQNVYAADHHSVPWQCNPGSLSDYGPGAWSPAWTTTSGYRTPVIDHSRCNGIYRVTAAGVATKVDC